MTKHVRMLAAMALVALAPLVRAGAEEIEFYYRPGALCEPSAAVTRRLPCRKRS